MAKEKIQRPESAAVKDMIARATRIDEGLLAMQGTEKEHRRAEMGAGAKGGAGALR